MLAKLEMKLRSTGMLSRNMASLFHGVLMERIPGDYAESMHVSGLHPYTQHLEIRDKEWYWIVTCTNREAVEVIIQQSLMPLKVFRLTHADVDVEIIEKNYSEMSFSTLTENFYQKDASRYIQLHFLTPTAFKSQGRYVFYPDVHSIYQSLANKYDAASVMEEMYDDETIDELTEKTQIIRYDLRSISFHLEGVKIPAFIGKVTLKIHGTQTMTNFANMLFRFGEFSGVGIKASLGMGAIAIIDDDRGRRRPER